MEKALPRAVRLDPFSIEDELRDGPLTNMPDDFLGSARSVLNVDFGVGNLVPFKEPFGFAAIAAP